jgi:hypothetical protein
LKKDLERRKARNKKNKRKSLCSRCRRGTLYFCRMLPMARVSEVINAWELNLQLWLRATTMVIRIYSTTMAIRQGK